METRKCALSKSLKCRFLAFCHGNAASRLSWLKCFPVLQNPAEHTDGTGDPQAVRLIRWWSVHTGEERCRSKLAPQNRVSLLRSTSRCVDCWRTRSWLHLPPRHTAGPGSAIRGERRQGGLDEVAAERCDVRSRWVSSSQGQVKVSQHSFLLK